MNLKLDCTNKDCFIQTKIDAFESILRIFPLRLHYRTFQLTIPTNNWVYCVREP